MDLEQCIKLLKNAKTDNEMMAALMLVSAINCMILIRLHTSYIAGLISVVCGVHAEYVSRIP